MNKITIGLTSEQIEVLLNVLHKQVKLQEAILDIVFTKPTDSEKRDSIQWEILGYRGLIRILEMAALIPALHRPDPLEPVAVSRKTDRDTPEDE